MIRRVLIPGYECVCELPTCPRQGRPWYSIAQRPPEACSICKSREWNGKKARRAPVTPAQIALPAPPKQRIIHEDLWPETGRGG